MYIQFFNWFLYYNSIYMQRSCFSSSDLPLLSSHFDNRDAIWWKVQIMKFLKVNFTLFILCMLLELTHHPIYAICDTSFMTYRLLHVSAPRCHSEGLYIFVIMNVWGRYLDAETCRSWNMSWMVYQRVHMLDDTLIPQSEFSTEVHLN